MGVYVITCEILYFRKTSLEPGDDINKDDMTTIYFNAVFAGRNKAGKTHTRNALPMDTHAYTCIHSN